ncbi:DUF4261 domain-containing protein [Flavobacterium sp. I3-2]|uniref:DUF4261 domain-containing protein n=1 Tax=Flavobacterium sp. I3-2 TaxID=2748319 RepID=UPI0015B012DD|nr:DUF4261 domain-containing protein [Flavobacterium sp. I3-2]
MKQFDKLELEIVNSKSPINEIHTFILKTASYVIRKNVTLKDNKTIEFTVNQKILIKKSEGKFLRRFFKVDILNM